MIQIASCKGTVKHMDSQKELEDEFFKPSARLPFDLVNKLQPDLSMPVHVLSTKVAQPLPYDSRMRLQFNRTGLDGHIEGINLVPVALNTITDGMSVTRGMSSLKNNVRGRAGQMPFTPGGLEIQDQDSAQQLHHNEQGLLDRAPGLSRGGRFAHRPASELSNLTEVLAKEDDQGDLDVDLGDTDDIISLSSTSTSESGAGEVDRLRPSKFSSIDDLLPNTASFVRQVTLPIIETPKERVWAHVVDVNKKMDNFEELVPHPARTWPFELDNFQKEAVYHLEQGDSVFIAAHTSAGKTVIAEYAMSLADKHMTKCIYTSPIKALSNQKYRDFKEEYEVGILTGDVQLNPEASTLIMTTEILRSMLYKGADVIRDVEYIIFDEVHYVNDSERGVVWEEVIIMLPEHVKLVLLSATVPNTFEFANWVGRTKEKEVYVISTPKRPVPLKHHLWLKNKVIEIVDEKRQFNPQDYKKAQELLNPPKKDNNAGSNAARGGGATGRGGANVYGGTRGGTAAAGRGDSTGRGGARGSSRGGNAQQALKRQAPSGPGRFNSGQAAKTELLNLVEHLKKEKLMPAVFFVFSRKLCEQYAEFMHSVNLNSGREKSQVHMFMDRAMQRLREEDRHLPQIETLRGLLEQGIGVHHSGLLPIMKEVVEILFAKGLVKLLFATETFAMGLNLPTRTVVFTSIRKFDSKTMRLLSPGEYTQMAGRAGRRGLDSTGTVIIMNNNKEEVIPRFDIEATVLGVPLKLSSQFRLTYNMILSLLRIEALRVEDVIQQSFSENANNVMKPKLQQRLLVVERDAQNIHQEITSASNAEFNDLATVMKKYLESESSYAQLTNKIYSFSAASLPRLVKKGFCVARYRNQLQLCFILNINPGVDKQYLWVLPFAVINHRLSVFPNFMVALPSLCLQVTITPTNAARCCAVAMKDVMFISNLKSKSNVSSRNATKEEIDTLVELYNTSKDEFWKELDFGIVRAMECRMALRDRVPMITALQRNGDELLTEMDKLKNTKKGQLPTEVVALVQKVGNLLELEGEAVSIKASSGSNTALLPEYEQRINLLRTANYIDEGLTVALKGRVACEISTGYELYVTELIMDNFLGSFDPEEIVALLSVFVFEGARGAEDPPTVTPRLDEGKERLLELVDYVQKLAADHQVSLTQDEADFAENNRFALMQVVYEWSRGMTFSEITTLTPIQEGLIVRVINRLDEVCRSVMSAARIIGEVDLYDKLAIAQELIKRDIVFCSSLYL